MESKASKTNIKRRMINYPQKDPTRKFLSKNTTKSSFLRWQKYQKEMT